MKKSENGERPLHRSRDYKREERKEEKQNKKLTWYKGKDGKSFDSVIMVPSTPGCELQKKIQEKAKQSRLKVRVVEKPGIKLGSYI